ncbi:MAG: hypothetical protein ACHBNF_10215 [Chromatiales bacterium]
MSEVLAEIAMTPPTLPEPVRLWLEAEEQLACCIAGACIEAGRIGDARSRSDENRGQRHSIEEDALCSFG